MWWCYSLNFLALWDPMNWSTGFFRQECWSGFPFPSPGDFPDPGIKLASLVLAARFFTTEPPRKPFSSVVLSIFTLSCSQSLELSYLAQLKLYALGDSSPSSSYPSPGSSTFCFHDWIALDTSLQAESGSICLFVTISFNRMSSRFIHAIACVRISFLLKV